MPSVDGTQVMNQLIRATYFLKLITAYKSGCSELSGEVKGLQGDKSFEQRRDSNTKPKRGHPFSVYHCIDWDTGEAH